jgi:thioredoxin
MATYDISTEEELEGVMASHDIVVLDFWAPWCPPCRAFAPILDEASGRNEDIAFCRVNAAEKQPISGEFGVSSIPSLIVIREGMVVANEQGYFEREKLDEFLRQIRNLDMDALREEPASPARA